MYVYSLREINACIVLSIYLQIVPLLVYLITCNHCLFKKKGLFFSLPMKMFIISERSNCMNKASSVTNSYLQNFFFFCQSRCTFSTNFPKRTFDVCDLL